MMAKLIILCRSRVGSYFLLDLLKNFQETSVESEIFNHTRTSHSKALDQIKKILMLKHGKDQRSIAANYGHLYYHDMYSELKKYYRRHQPNKILVFKILYHQIPFTFLQKILTEPNTHVIVLERNYLDCLISYAKAKEIKCWNLVDTSNVQINLNNIELRKLCFEYFNKFKDEKRIKQFLLDRKISYSIINYSDLEKNLQNQLNFLRQLIQNKFNLFLTPIKNPKLKYFKQDFSDKEEIKQKFHSLFPNAFFLKDNFTGF